MTVAFVCLATLAILRAGGGDKEGLSMVADCETTDWSEWTVCPEACGEGKQTRERHITVSYKVEAEE